MIFLYRPFFHGNSQLQILVKVNSSLSPNEIIYLSYAIISGGLSKPATKNYSTKVLSRNKNSHVKSPHRLAKIEMQCRGV
jgi:hypothetical protein